VSYAVALHDALIGRVRVSHVGLMRRRRSRHVRFAPQKQTLLSVVGVSAYDPQRKSGCQSCCDAQQLIQLCARLEI
jgi:hypothetical protein